MKTFFGALFLITIGTFQPVSGQDTIRLIGGKDIPSKIVAVDSIRIQYHPGGTSEKIKTIERYKVFAINYADGTEKIIYRDDSTASDYFAAEQMRLFIKGEKDAKKFYKPKAPFLVGIISGGAGAMLAPIFVALTPIPPGIGITIVGSRAPDINKHKITNEALRDVPEFRMGYEHQARKIRMKRALFGGCIGLTGALAYLFLR